MIGNTLNASAVQSLRNMAKRWGAVIFGIAVLMALTLVSLRTVLASQGIGQASTISTADMRQLSHTDQPPVASTVTKEKIPITTPKRMLLPTIELGLDVINSTVNTTTGDWPLSITSAHYANFTPGLGSKKGTLLLYGHATWSVLGKTNSLKIGDELVLLDENEHSWRFALVQEKNVTPEQVDFIYEDVPFRVVIFTCYGWSNEYRHLMYFSPI